MDKVPCPDIETGTLDEGLNGGRRKNTLVKVEKPYSAEKVDSNKVTVTQVRASWDFEARDESELSFKAGDEIVVTIQAEGGWWMGSLHGKEGKIPINRCVVIQILEKKLELKINQKNVTNRIKALQRAISRDNIKEEPPKEPKKNSSPLADVSPISNRRRRRISLKLSKGIDVDGDSATETKIAEELAKKIQADEKAIEERREHRRLERERRQRAMEQEEEQRKKQDQKENDKENSSTESDSTEFESSTEESSTESTSEEESTESDDSTVESDDDGVKKVDNDAANDDTSTVEDDDVKKVDNSAADDSDTDSDSDSDTVDDDDPRKSVDREVSSGSDLETAESVNTPKRVTDQNSSVDYVDNDAAKDTSADLTDSEAEYGESSSETTSSS